MLLFWLTEESPGHWEWYLQYRGDQDCHRYAPATPQPTIKNMHWDLCKENNQIHTAKILQLTCKIYILKSTISGFWIHCLINSTHSSSSCCILTNSMACNLVCNTQSTRTLKISQITFKLHKHMNIPVLYPLVH